MALGVRGRLAHAKPVPWPLVAMNLLLVLMVLLVIVLTYMARHGGYGP
jgi:hypothetical protein